MAEFDNFRKRTEKGKSQMYEIGAKDIIEKILPVVDNFESGIAGAVPEEEKSNPVCRRNGKDLQTADDYTRRDWRKTDWRRLGQNLIPDFPNAA